MSKTDYISTFYDIKLKDKVYSIVFGQGRVVFVLPKKQRVSGFHMMEVEFMNKQRVFFSEDGIPNWCPMNTTGDCQTLFKMEDIDISKIDFRPITRVITEKQIMKYKDKGILEMRCPSGLWRNIKICPERLVMIAFKKLNLHMFRKER